MTSLLNESLSSSTFLLPAIAAQCKSIKVTYYNNFILTQLSLKVLFCIYNHALLFFHVRVVGKKIYLIANMSAGPF